MYNYLPLPTITIYLVYCPRLLSNLRAVPAKFGAPCATATATSLKLLVPA